MAKFRKTKTELSRILASTDRNVAMDAATALSPMESVSPLLALLPRGGLLKWRAADALGLQVAALEKSDLEAARNVMRRLMWHLNEDSGNLGWGIPEAMGCVLAASPVLAGEFGRILCSYVRETGKADNFLEHGPLRAAAWWGVSRLAFSGNTEAGTALALLPQGVADPDGTCRAVSLWALAEGGARGLVTVGPELAARVGGLRGDTSRAEVYDNGQVEVVVAGDCARKLLEVVGI